jgi:hypothetical protein
LKISEYIGPKKKEMSFTGYILYGDSETAIFVQSSDGYGDANISEQAEFTNPA